jgi:D-beta-D-heptose 7-phosphate kinase/D-beta-D-heptose 1-phosphate adenosyltransferase
MDSLGKFANAKILVIGDVMLDRYLWGTVNRISPEAPVPVVLLERQSYVPGGAANVAGNIVQLRGLVDLVGIIGDDKDGDEFTRSLEISNVPADNIIRIPGRATTLKTRIIAHSQQVVRVDQESAEPLHHLVEDQIIDRVQDLIENADLIVISDYLKGLLSRELITRVIGAGKKYDKKIIVDPKGKDFSKYKGASVLTPNKKEAADACGLDAGRSDVVAAAGEKLMADLGLEALLITESHEGMTLVEEPGRHTHFNAMAREVYDVTGAGDTVIACFALALAAGESPRDAAYLGNLAASIVVTQVGTACVTLEQLSNALSREQASPPEPSAS